MGKEIIKSIGSYDVSLYKFEDDCFNIGFDHKILDFDECPYCEIFLYKDEIKKLCEFLKYTIEKRIENA